ncbi:hypothetical protein LEP1GSC016_2956 [Leptospira borgpetersenii serovar Hardjo-bovis str. Sponselee]|uniref:Uncharacterized protein n=1 Tax=Leptospira borgpetersenii serovar Hardjo-bovis str. Sponselee TaxID=1303729 RepID=M6BUR1_LEPBO|nr:hypothetical protein LEP1GSC016_2956 [Leptospira borgpetersenii serovar Hardjo-bovis str. Sponselee]
MKLRYKLFSMECSRIWNYFLTIKSVEETYKFAGNRSPKIATAKR